VNKFHLLFILIDVYLSFLFVFYQLSFKDDEWSCSGKVHDHASQSSTENCARSAPIFPSQKIQNGEGTNQASSNCLEVQPQPSGQEHERSL
jgi:hypothetical protein